MAVAEDKRRLSARVTAIQAVVLAAFVLLVGGFWFFQIAQGDKFKEMAENNHTRTLPLRAPRGVIVDRHGQVLVENRNSFNISILREHSKDIDGTVRRLAELTGVPEQQIRETVARHRHEPSYRPIVVINDATLDQMAAVKARRLDHELPDVVVQEVPTRKYPPDALAAHLIGYVGEANEAQVSDGGFALGAVVGQTGVEKNYNDALMGRDGARVVVVNSLGREIAELDEIPATAGQRVQLTLSLAMQKAAEDAFRAMGFWGSAIVLDPRNGDVLTLASLPSYDPNAFAAGIDRAAYQALITDKLRPLQNRAIQGRYSPGSTFKVLVATAGLEEGVITPSFRVTCPGGGNFYGRWFQCLSRHGSVDLRDAIAKSCNTYFYTLGNMLGVDRMHKWAVNLGLHGKSGIDLPNEQDSLVPSTEWKRQRTGERWYPGETISVAIGQGQNAVTPMALAVMMASVANGGTRHVPRLVRAVDDGEGWIDVPPPVNPFPSMRLKPETVKAVHDGLWMAVNGTGTAARARVEGRDVSGKTGTAQVVSLQGRERARGSGVDVRDHGWFVFMAPRDNPEIAGVVFGEHSEGSRNTTPIARHIIETYYAEKEGRPLPVFQNPFAPPPVPARAVAAASPQPPAPSRVGGTGAGGR
jgi:penicillin-binding protein 2